MLSNKSDWKWAMAYRVCFGRVKKALYVTPILKIPDFTQPFEVSAGALDQVVGAILLQPYNDKLYPVA